MVLEFGVCNEWQYCLLTEYINRFVGIGDVESFTLFVTVNVSVGSEPFSILEVAFLDFFQDFHVSSHYHLSCILYIGAFDLGLAFVGASVFTSSDEPYFLCFSTSLLPVTAKFLS